MVQLPLLRNISHLQVLVSLGQPRVTYSQLNFPLILDIQGTVSSMIAETYSLTFSKQTNYHW